jgi:hypothetical protein
MINDIDSINRYIARAIENRLQGKPDLVPSEYWTDFAVNFRYVYELREAELNRIRFHTYHLTSDSYLTYYFADDAFKSLLINGYRYFVCKNSLNQLDEGVDGIGAETEYGRISHDLLRYLGVVVDLLRSDLLDRTKPQRVVEIGGGYGGLARSLLTQNPNISYFICDLEETIFFSAVYLSRHFGAHKVHLVSSKLSPFDIEQGHIYIIPQSKIEYFDNLQFDYSISQQSIQEMTQKQVERYLLWMSKHSTYFYSCNIFDHKEIAFTKSLAKNIPNLLELFFSNPIWQGDEPLVHERYGDNHLLRSVYKCR